MQNGRTEVETISTWSNHEENEGRLLLHRWLTRRSFLEFRQSY